MTSRLSADCQKVGDQVQLNVNVFLRSVIQVGYIPSHAVTYRHVPLHSNVFLRSAMQVVFTLVLMFYLSPKLALASFVIVPAIVGISKVCPRPCAWPCARRVAAHALRRTRAASLSSSPAT